MKRRETSSSQIANVSPLRGMQPITSRDFLARYCRSRPKASPKLPLRVRKRQKTAFRGSAWLTPFSRTDCTRPDANSNNYLFNTPRTPQLGSAGPCSAAAGREPHHPYKHS